jgi:hypothetical protein
MQKRIITSQICSTNLALDWTGVFCTQEYLQHTHDVQMCLQLHHQVCCMFGGKGVILVRERAGCGLLVLVLDVECWIGWMVKNFTTGQSYRPGPESNRGLLHSSSFVPMLTHDAQMCSRLHHQVWLDVWRKGVIVKARSVAMGRWRRWAWNVRWLERWALKWTDTQKKCYMFD